ncbi:small conductance mechanosensitive channel [Monaibacterium marinum]|uniref:Small-conductance mechanosensitive channel n=1 Tax=Pontivivens marinum TaxID=1690039 RepID=A0A2C9CN64_9RHOB|nr:mechanosensitive ion channel domain-containing protein [Monaibacterium marinum]SOH92961.1 small conductance mechanosensitive channel [Monaibacterium marinum]
MEWWLELIFDVLVAGVIAIVAFIVAGFVNRQIRNLGKRHERFDETLFNFLGTVARYVVLTFALIFILARFGIQTASLIAVIGAAGLAIGLALQGTLSNLASGLMLLAFRPFKIGDYIEAGGQSGTVTEIALFTCELTTPDNIQVFVPNGDIWSGAIRNYSFHDNRRVDLVFGVGYGANLKLAEEVIRATLAQEERIHDDQPIFVKVTSLGDSSVDFTVRVWASSADFWNVKFDLMQAVKEAMDAANIDIPFPTRTIINA